MLAGRHTSHAVVTGAGGWVGRCALDRLAESGDCVTAVALSRREVRTRFDTWHTVAMQDVLASRVGDGSLVVHCGFPTQDRVSDLGEGPYLDTTTALREEMLALIAKWGPLDVIYLSSGAATSVMRGLDVARRTQIYGQAKLEDEAAYREALATVGGRLCIVRAFALSGPYMTKPETYALGSMIQQALGGGAIEVRAPQPVHRSYMAIDDMLRIAMHAVGELGSAESITFETAGEVVEVGELASRVLGVLGCDPEAVTRPPLDPSAPADDYLGDPGLVGELAARGGVTPASLDEQIAVTAGWLREQVAA